MNQTKLAAALLFAAMALTCAAASAQVRPATPAEKALDQAAFQAAGPALAERLTDVQSVVVLLHGRVAYEFYRDGAPDTLREIQSVRKSALSTLVGLALAQGKLASLDQPVLGLMPEWAGLNPDPRAASITVRHLLTLSAGFEFNDPEGNTGGNTPPAVGWARRLRYAPGEKFGYDNALIPMLTAVLEKAVGMTVPDFARVQLVAPMGMVEPSYRGGVGMRTLDMAKLGQLFLRDGQWDGKQLVPAEFVRAATGPQNSGGPPVKMPYGYMWWIVPSQEPRPIFMASGYAGQMIWVHPTLDLVVAATSTVSADSQSRGHSIRLLRGLVEAAAQRAKDEPR